VHIIHKSDRSGALSTPRKAEGLSTGSKGCDLRLLASKCARGDRRVSGATSYLSRRVESKHVVPKVSPKAVGWGYLLTLCGDSCPESEKVPPFRLPHFSYSIRLFASSDVRRVWGERSHSRSPD